MIIFSRSLDGPGLSSGVANAELEELREIL